jgi:hypothetical protein
MFGLALLRGADGALAMEKKEPARGHDNVPAGGKISPQKPEAPLTWDSRKILEIKGEWQALNRSIPNSRDTYGTRIDAVRDLFRTRLSKEEMRELAASCTALPIPRSKWTEFEVSLFESLFVLFQHSGDRESLVTLLSGRCPTGLYNQSLEYCLVADAGEIKIKDPILVLGDAYAKCQIPEVRKTIATCVRQAFIGLGVVGRDDAEFVKNAMEFYKREKENLTLNYEYPLNLNTWFQPYTGRQPYLQNPLFQKKPEVADKPQTEQAGTKVAWDSARLLPVKRQYETADSLDAEPHDRWRARRAVLRNMLTKRFSKEDLHELAASCATTPIEEKDRSQFANDLIDELVLIFLDSRDREGLVTVLSTRCPRIVGFSCDIERALAMTHESIRDPILILGDAYSKCQVPEVRREIADAVRRGFTNLGVRGKDDAQFVKNAMQFYEQQKEQLIFNPYYSFGTLKENFLFKRKAQSDSKPAKPADERDGEKH